MSAIDTTLHPYIYLHTFPRQLKLKLFKNMYYDASDDCLIGK